MGYYEEKVSLPCPQCGSHNHIIAAYAGDSRANESEPILCFSCKELVTTIQCWAAFGAASADEAEQKLRRVQNRA